MESCSIDSRYIMESCSVESRPLLAYYLECLQGEFESAVQQV